MYDCNTRDAILLALSNVMYNVFEVWSWLYNNMLFVLLTRIVFCVLCPIYYLI